MRHFYQKCRCQSHHPGRARDKPGTLASQPLPAVISTVPGSDHHRHDTITNLNPVVQQPDNNNLLPGLLRNTGHQARSTACCQAQPPHKLPRTAHAEIGVRTSKREDAAFTSGPRRRDAVMSARRQDAAMHDRPAVASGEIPSPWLVAAWVRLDMVPAERLPCGLHTGSPPATTETPSACSPGSAPPMIPAINPGDPPGRARRLRGNHPGLRRRRAGGLHQAWRGAAPTAGRDHSQAPAQAVSAAN